MQLPRNFRPPAALILLLALSGCAGYRLGPTTGIAARYRTLCVMPFANETLEPRLPEAVQSALLHTLQQEGTYRVTRRDEADVVVTGRIVEYERGGIAYDPNDVRTITDFRVVLRAEVTATETATGRRLLEETVAGRTTVRLGADQPSAERQALPLVAENLSRNITSRLVDGDW